MTIRKRHYRTRAFIISIPQYRHDTAKKLQDLHIIKYAISYLDDIRHGRCRLHAYVQLTKPQTVRAFQKKLHKSGVNGYLWSAPVSLKYFQDYSKKKQGCIEWGTPTSRGTRTDLNWDPEKMGLTTDIEGHPYYQGKRVGTLDDWYTASKEDLTQALK